MKRCLEALERQTCRDFEAVVIDDCSTDDSYQKLLDYKANAPFAIKVLRNDKNVGPGKSRETAVSQASGEWIAFCDCDDWYERDFLETMLSTAISEAADLVICDYKYVYGTGGQKRIGTLDRFAGQPSRAEILAFSEMTLCRIMAKRRVFDGVVFPAIYHAEDAAVVPQLIAAAEKIALQRRALYNYFIRGDSASNKPDKRVAKEFITAFSVVEAAIGKEFPEECCFIGIMDVLCAATLNMFKAGYSGREVRAVVEDFNRRYPDWQSNGYMKHIPRAKTVYLYCIRRSLFALARVFGWAHALLIKIWSFN